MDGISKKDLMDFLESFDLELDRRIMLIAVGGTAMTLLGIKASTKDIDFNIPSEKDFEEFARVKDKIKPGVKIDCWKSNMVFSEILPKDYAKIATGYKSRFSKIDIRLLNPIDIACSKISRSNEADMEDIRDCIEKFGITRTKLKERAQKYSRAGNDDTFNRNLEYILQNMF
jgi:hypothetical protein